MPVNQSSRTEWCSEGNLLKLFVIHQAERLRKQAEQEKHEAVENLAQVTNQNNTLTQAKRKLEGQINTLQEEAEDLENEAKNADDRAKKAAIEVMLDLTYCYYCTLKLWPLFENIDRDAVYLEVKWITMSMWYINNART